MKARPMLQRILAGVDGTPRSDEVVGQAARLAAVTGAALEIVHVLKRVGASRVGTGLTRLDAAEAMLLEAGKVAAKEGVEADLRVLVGEPSTMLAAEAAQHWCDLVCVGPDAGFFEKPHLLGGVTAHLVHRGVKPVLVTRPAPERASRRFPSRILVAVDSSERAVEAVRLAGSIAAVAGSDLRILHVVPVLRGRSVGWTLEGDREGFEPLEPAVDLARSLGVNPTREMSMGRPGPVIVAVADEWDADLIAVGDRGLGGVGRVALGSVSDYVTRHSGRSVLVARHREPSH